MANVDCAGAGVHDVFQEDSGEELRDPVQVADAKQQGQYHRARCAISPAHVAGEQLAAPLNPQARSFLAATAATRRPILCQQSCVPSQVPRSIVAS